MEVQLVAYSKQVNESSIIFCKAPGTAETVLHEVFAATLSPETATVDIERTINFGDSEGISKDLAVRYRSNP